MKNFEVLSKTFWKFHNRPNVLLTRLQDGRNRLKKKW